METNYKTTNSTEAARLSSEQLHRLSRQLVWAMRWELFKRRVENVIDKITPFRATNPRTPGEWAELTGKVIVFYAIVQALAWGVIGLLAGLYAITEMVIR